MATVKTRKVAGVRLTEAFAAPFALHYRRSGDIVSTAAARRQGAIAVTVEMEGLVP